MAPIDAVVVTYNSMLDLPGLVDCAPFRQAFSRVVVVDNASTDATVTVARRAGLDVIERGRNDGFATAANEGVRQTSAPFVCILNSDIRFSTSDVAERLAGHFVDPKVGVVAPTLVLPDGSEQDSAREVPVPIDLVKRRLRQSNLGWVRPAQAAPVPWVVGACLLIRREAFDSVNGFDERFRLYFEDVDLCVRLRQRSWQIMFDPVVQVNHYHRASSRGSLTCRSTRRHIVSATRFYLRYPRHVLSH